MLYLITIFLLVRNIIAVLAVSHADFKLRVYSSTPIGMKLIYEFLRAYEYTVSLYCICLEKHLSVELLAEEKRLLQSHTFGSSYALAMIVAVWMDWPPYFHANNIRYSGFSVIYWAAGGTCRCAVRFNNST